jgi:hypothetical protein
MQHLLHRHQNRRILEKMRRFMCLLNFIKGKTIQATARTIAFDLMRGLLSLAQADLTISSNATAAVRYLRGGTGSLKPAHHNRYFLLC